MSASLLKVVFALVPTSCPVGGSHVYCSGHSREDVIDFLSVVFLYIFKEANEPRNTNTRMQQRKK
jgi:hypothetical protein